MSVKFTAPESFRAEPKRLGAGSLSICYDLRFPQDALAHGGADLIGEPCPPCAPSFALHVAGTASATRWRWRHFNQSALLAATVSRDSGTAWIPNLMVRARATKSQARLSANERRKNVRGAFRVRKRHAELVRGKTILLVDDVITTGATAEACAQALLRGGAAGVDVLTLARTLDRST